MHVARCCDMPPEQARELARQTFAKAAQGQDPAAERAAPAVEDTRTVERVFQGYVASLWARKRASAREVERALLKAKDNAADALGRKRPAAEVTPADVVNYVSRFFHAGHRGAANKHRGYIGAAYNWALTSANDYTIPAGQRVDLGVTRNPVDAVAKDPGAMRTRDRNLTADELRTLWAATAPGSAGFKPETAACIRLLICCGQRVQETLRIEGRDVDLKAGVWRMPAEKTKGGRFPHIVPLPRQAVGTLAELLAAHGDGLLFPGRTGSKVETLNPLSVMQAIKRWQAGDDVDMPAFQTRDIRRTVKSRAHDAGIGRFEIDLIQQHARSDTGSRHYDRADYLEQMRAGMAKWADWLDENVAY
jgi:integrase